MERVAIVDSFAAWSAPKTKDALAALERARARGQDPRRARAATTRSRSRSFRNLGNVKTIDAGEINAYDVLDCDWVLFTDATLPAAKEIN